MTDIGEMMKRIEYVVGNPSAWEAYDESKSEMFREAARALTALEAENKALRRTATDRRYMLESYRAMLGPIALKVIAAWGARGVRRHHTSWGPQAHELTGEGRAQILLDVMTARSEPVDDIDALGGDHG